MSIHSSYSQNYLPLRACCVCCCCPSSCSPCRWRAWARHSNTRVAGPMASVLRLPPQCWPMVTIWAYWICTSCRMLPVTVGWNGKRSVENERLPNRLLNRFLSHFLFLLFSHSCLSHLQHLVGNGLLHRSFANGLAYEASRPDVMESKPVRSLNLRSRTSASSSSNGSSNNNNNNNENGLYSNSINHRQSSELYEALNAAVAASAPVGESVEPNDYGKHW